MAAWNPRANDIFLRALEIHESDERHTFLNQACDGAAELRSEVEELLQASERPEVFWTRRPRLSDTWSMKNLHFGKAPGP